MNYFELFELAPALVLEPAELATRYRTLQQRYHPDRFAAAPDAERLQALQQAAEINAAYQVLKDGLARAEYLLAVRGHDIRGEQQTLQDPEFLMQQLAWREDLEALREQADASAALPVMEQRVRSEYRRLESALAEAYAADQLPRCADLVRKLKFVRKLQQELERLEDSLMDL